ncbi:MAG: hypothetical protein H6732_13080 [Alphaproteobacteria bacterium]|nr:hypothetical protein [Alphaproteobacteria bacterium]
MRAVAMGCLWGLVGGWLVGQVWPEAQATSPPLCHGPSAALAQVSTTCRPGVPASLCQLPEADRVTPLHGDGPPRLTISFAALPGYEVPTLGFTRVESDTGLEDPL